MESCITVPFFVCFRNRILSFEPENSADGGSLLRDLFHNMQTSSENEHHLRRFITSLEIDVNVLGDAHEFHKSFMVTLFPPLSNVLKTITGKVRYKTTCHGCRKVSADECPFMDLCLPIINCNNLYAAIDGESHFLEKK